MSPSQVEYLRHILDETDFILTHTQNISHEHFLKDETLKRAVTRSLEIIGEAAKKVSDEFKQRYASIEWKLIAGMRDRLIHDYFGIDYDIVWDVIVNKIPKLRSEVDRIIQIESK